MCEIRRNKDNVDAVTKCCENCRHYFYDRFDMGFCKLSNKKNPCNNKDKWELKKGANYTD